MRRSGSLATSTSSKPFAGSGRLQHADQLVHARAELLERHEARDVDGQIELADAHRLAGKSDAAEFGADGAPAEDRAQNFDHDGEAAAFVAAERHEQPVIGFVGAGGGDAFFVHGPARGDGRLSYC